MRKIISLMHASLDGITAGPNGEMDWIVYNQEIFKDAIELTNTVDTAIYGRDTYQGMYGYWPSVLANPESSQDDLHHANWVQNVDKIVISRSLDKVEWNKSKLIKENISQEMAKLKQQSGKNMMIFGSPRLVHVLAELDLVDEYRVNVSPVVLGAGTPLFEGAKGKTNLKLLRSKTFDVGVVGLHYEVVR